MPTGTSARRRSRTLSRSSSSELARVGVAAALVAPASTTCRSLDDRAALPDDEAAGRTWLTPGERRARRARAPEREDLVDAGEVGRGGDLAGGEQRLRLGAEDERPVAEHGA